MTTQNFLSQTQKSGWAKNLAGKINWVGQTLNWVGQCLAGPPVALPLRIQFKLPPNFFIANRVMFLLPNRDLCAYEVYFLLAEVEIGVV